MKKCLDCGANVEDIETRCLVCNAWLPQPRHAGLRNPRGPMRTDGGRRPGLRAYHPEGIVTPVADSASQLIWTGERKQLGGFPERLVDELLAEADPQNGRYKCRRCGKHFPRKRDRAEGEDYISIDHVVPIRDFVVLHVTPRIETLHRHRWEIYRLDECKHAHLTRANLEPLCQPCNSRKNGNQELDGEMRLHDPSQCPECRRLRRPGPY